MKPTNASPLCAAFLVLLPLSLPAQQPHLTARDAFWSASDLISVTPNPAAHAMHARHRPHTTTAHKQAAAPAMAPANATVPVEEASAGNSAPESTGAIKLVSDNGYGAAPRLVRSADDRLGLRCSVLLRDAGDQYAEVSPDSVFHSGDHIRLSLLANEPGYLYVIGQGSTGNWSPIFPPPTAPADAATIAAGQLEIVPSGARAFQFDQHPGDEKLFVILSRSPIEDIDRVIQNLKGGNAPSAQPSMPESGAAPVLEAENRIPDIFVQQLASRDLTLVDEQKVDQSSTASHGGEKAIYVVSKGNGAEGGSQVILQLNLRHE